MLKAVGYNKILIIILLIILFIMFRECLSFESKEEFLLFLKEMEGNYNIGMVYIIITILTSIFCFPISWMKAIGGICFGVGKGFIYSIIAASVSSAISFMIARALGRESILAIKEKYFKDKMNPKLQKIFSKKTGLSFTYVFLLRNIYFIPFGLTNYLLGITSISFRQYILASILGMIPGTFSYTYFFAKATEIQHDVSILIYPLLIIGCYYIVIYKWRKKLILL